MSACKIPLQNGRRPDTTTPPSTVRAVPRGAQTPAATPRPSPKSASRLEAGKYATSRLLVIAIDTHQPAEALVIEPWSLPLICHTASKASPSAAPSSWSASAGRCSSCAKRSSACAASVSSRATSIFPNPRSRRGCGCWSTRACSSGSRIPGIDPGRHEYRLTDAGRDLFGAIVALMRWGDEHLPHPSRPPVVLRHDACGEIADPRLTCARCDEEITAHNVTPEAGPGFRTDLGDEELA
jgi:hypothetical protein